MMFPSLPNSWLIELPYWFKIGFCPKFREFNRHELQKIILCDVRFNPHKVTLREVTLHEVMSHQCDYSLLNIFLL